MSRDVEITILNRKYTLRSEGDERELLDVAAFVDGKLREVGKSMTAPPTSVAILGALNIASEYFEYRRKVESNLKEVEERSQAILSLIESAEAGVSTEGDGA